MNFLTGNFTKCPTTFLETAQKTNLAGIYLFKVSNRNTRTRCEICSKLTIKTPMYNKGTSVFWCLDWLWTYFPLCFSVSVVSFEHVIAGWEHTSKVSRYHGTIWKFVKILAVRNIWKLFEYNRKAFWMTCHPLVPFIYSLESLTCCSRLFCMGMVVKFHREWSSRNQRPVVGCCPL